MSAPDAAKSQEIMKLEAEKQRENTKLNLASARGAWTDAKLHATRLVEIEAELAAVRSRVTTTDEHVIGRFKAQG